MIGAKIYLNMSCEENVVGRIHSTFKQISTSAKFAPMLARGAENLFEFT